MCVCVCVCCFCLFLISCVYILLAARSRGSKSETRVSKTVPGEVKTRGRGKGGTCGTECGWGMNAVKCLTMLEWCHLPPVPFQGPRVAAIDSSTVSKRSEMGELITWTPRIYESAALVCTQRARVSAPICSWNNHPSPPPCKLHSTCKNGYFPTFWGAGGSQQWKFNQVPSSLL